METHFWLVSLWLLLFMAIAITELIRHLERSKRELSNFLAGIRQNDFSNTYTDPSRSTLDQEIHHAFTTITEEFTKLRREKESNYHFLQAVVEHSGIPLLGYEEDTGEVHLLNQAAKVLFQKPFMKNISALQKLNRELANVVEQLKSGEKKLVKTVVGNELLHLSVLAKELKLSDEFFKLVSFQNIRAELDEKELESWQKLIRVLTHEIKNSAIPISTLTEVVNQLMFDHEGNMIDLATLEDEDLEDIKMGLQTVQKRSMGLVHFVNAYGELAKLPQPKIVEVDIQDMMKDMEMLLTPDLKKAKINLVISVANIITVQADAEMFEQVLINLIKNAKEALKNTVDAKIEINILQREGQVIVEVSDNGPGIDHVTLDQIFIPFFTTKKEGSGIGLSLSRQIMRAHKGNLTVHSQLGQGTVFYLTL